MAAHFQYCDSLWDILCNRLPEGYELGGFSWTISMNTLYMYRNLTLQQKRVISGIESIYRRNMCVVFLFCLFLTHTCLNVLVLSYFL